MNEYRRVLHCSSADNMFCVSIYYNDKIAYTVENATSASEIESIATAYEQGHKDDRATKDV